jgi:hypothetical protein
MYKTKGNIAKARDAALVAFRKPKVLDEKMKHLNDENHFLVNCFNYWNEWILKDTKLDTLLLPNDSPATEVTFSLPYYEDDYVTVKLEGTIDRIVKIKGGCYAINDFKTTSSWNTKEYLDNYAMSQQLRFYVFALKLMAFLHPSSMLGTIGATNVGAVIDGIFLKPSAADTVYQRSDVFIYKDLDTFKQSLDAVIQRVSRTVCASKLDNIPPTRDGIVNGSCESRWGKCSFWNVCKVGDSVIEKVILNREFQKKEYNPLNHNDDTL